MNLKNLIIAVFTSTLLGYLCGLIVYRLYDNTLEDEINEKIYLLQSGAYSSLNSMKVNATSPNYVYYNEDGLYKTIIAMTKEKDNIEKIKNAYDMNMVINEYYLNNDTINNKIKEYDNLIKKTDDKMQIIEIVDEMIAQYKNEDLKLTKVY